MEEPSLDEVVETTLGVGLDLVESYVHTLRRIVMEFGEDWALTIDLVACRNPDGARALARRLLAKSISSSAVDPSHFPDRLAHAIEEIAADLRACFSAPLLTVVEASSGPEEGRAAAGNARGFALREPGTFEAMVAAASFVGVLFLGIMIYRSAGK